MSIWIERLCEEHNALEGKLAILAPFVAGERPEDVHVEQWGMMKAQALYMSQYLMVLKDRIQQATGVRP